MYTILYKQAKHKNKMAVDFKYKLYSSGFVAILLGCLVAYAVYLCSFFFVFNGISTLFRLFNAKAIHLEEQ